MIEIILGAILIISAISALIWAFARTPDNLRGFYGVAYTYIIYPLHHKWNFPHYHGILNDYPMTN